MTTQVLITGGSSGIGLELARRFAADGAHVIVTGRSAERLSTAEQAHPGIRGIVNDIATPHGREQLAAHVEQLPGGLDVLVNNAGIQRRVGLAEDDASWPERQDEIDILFAAPVHLTSLLVPGMVAHGRPALVVNVTSGGAFVPQPFAPVYSASKAALHSYTLTLRLALAGTACRVVELVPPAVATALAGDGQPHGASLDEFCDTVFPLLDGSRDEVGFGPTADGAVAQLRHDGRALFDAMSGRFPVPSYASFVPAPHARR